MKPIKTLASALLVPFALAVSGCGADVGDAPSTDEDVAEVSSAVAASVCGAGYKLVGLVKLDAANGFPPGGGELEVFYNASNGRNCLVNQALGAMYGKNKRMFVRVCTEDFRLNNKCSGGENFDGGDFKYYAGPVYVTAPNRCIYYAAGIYSTTTPKASEATIVYYVSGKGFCG